MKKFLLHLMMMSIFTCNSQAQNQMLAPAPKPAPKVFNPPILSSYCLPVAAGFLESEAKASDEMKKCSRGDTIVIPSKSAGSVARMCDFSKTIVALGENVVCVMVSPERASR